ncbi:MAG: ABC transporter ATP-binding protein [Candidatus Hermodarchaeota archaeon]
MHNILVIRNLVKKYGLFTALDGFSCEIPKGVCGLLGPNGAGKTTFIRALLGIHPFESGSINFLNYILPKDLLAVKDQIGYSPEIDTRILKTSAMRYVVHIGTMAGLSRNTAKQRAFDTLHYVGLGEARYRDMNTFSQGMMQKCKLATALIHDPVLLVLDEPTAGCDPKSHMQILDLISDLGNNHQKNILISTHLLPDIERTASYVVVMNQGKKIIQGDLKTILQQDDEVINMQIRVNGNHNKFAQLLQNNGFEVSTANEIISVNIERDDDKKYLSIFKLARNNGMNIRMMTTYRQSLEDVFLNEIAKDQMENK